MSKPTLGAGNVEIELDGQTVTLRPTLRAAQTISKQNGGILAAIQAVGRFDLEVITLVIALGLNKGASDVAEQVYSTGLVDFIEPLTRYLSMLANGGRPAADGGEEQKDPQ